MKTTKKVHFDCPVFFQHQSICPDFYFATVTELGSGENEGVILPYPRRELPVHIFWNVLLLLIKELQILSHTHGFMGDTTRYSENFWLRKWTSIQSTARKSVEHGYRKSQERTEPWYKNWTCRLTAYSLGIISETSSRDYINYGWDSQEKICWYVGKIWIKNKQSL